MPERRDAVGKLLASPTRLVEETNKHVDQSKADDVSIVVFILVLLRFCINKVIAVGTEGGRIILWKVEKCENTGWGRYSRSILDQS